MSSVCISYACLTTTISNDSSTHMDTAEGVLLQRLANHEAGRSNQANMRSWIWKPRPHLRKSTNHLCSSLTKTTLVLCSHGVLEAPLAGRSVFCNGSKVPPAGAQIWMVSVLGHGDQEKQPRSLNRPMFIFTFDRLWTTLEGVLASSKTRNIPIRECRPTPGG